MSKESLLNPTFRRSNSPWKVIRATYELCALLIHNHTFCFVLFFFFCVKCGKCFSSVQSKNWQSYMKLYDTPTVTSSKHYLSSGEAFGSIQSSPNTRSWSKCCEAGILLTVRAAISNFFLMNSQSLQWCFFRAMCSINIELSKSVQFFDQVVDLNNHNTSSETVTFKHFIFEGW